MTKLNASGSALVYSTYLGGRNQDNGNGIAIDSSGNAYVTGSTSSTDFPITPGAFQTTLKNQPNNAFVTKLNASGSALVYSTYLGGSSRLYYSNKGDYGSGIAVDSNGNAYVTGLATSTDFPVTPGAFQTRLRGTSYNNGPYEYAYNAFVTKLNVSGSALVYSTYLGGSGYYNSKSNITYGEGGSGIAVDSSGSAYVTGGTSSTDFPVTPGAFQTTSKTQYNAFVTKFNASGSALIYSTYLGGASNSIAIDRSGSAYVTGSTGRVDFPITPDAFQTSLKGTSDAFVTKFNASGSAVVYSTYLGGSGGYTYYGYYYGDSCSGIAVDSNGSVYVTGSTKSV